MILENFGKNQKLYKNWSTSDIKKLVTAIKKGPKVGIRHMDRLVEHAIADLDAGRSFSRRQINRLIEIHEAQKYANKRRSREF
jgi:hypothetical protein